MTFGAIARMAKTSVSNPRRGLGDVYGCMTECMFTVVDEEVSNPRRGLGDVYASVTLHGFTANDECVSNPRRGLGDVYAYVRAFETKKLRPSFKPQKGIR